MAPQSTNRKPFTPGDRRAEMVRREITQQEVADACEVDYSLVSRIVSGQRLGSRSAPRIMAYIARVIGQPLNVVFPEAGRRRTVKAA